MSNLLRLRHGVCATLLAFVAACDSGTAPEPTPTTIVIAPSTLSFSAIGLTQPLSAQVRDQDGNPMSGVTVTWSSASASVVEVSSTGAVTARGTGTTQVTARAGNASASATVEVTPTPASIVITPAAVSFDALGDTRALVAEVRDANANPIAGASVAWTTSAATVAEVSGTGTVTARGNGSAQVTARIGTVSGSATVQVAQVATQLVSVSGDAQQAEAGTQLPQDLVVEARDRLGAPVAGVSVTFAVTSGNGAVTPATVATNAQGRAAARWTLGAAAGAQGVRASAAGQQVTFAATATVPPPPAIASVISGLTVAGVPGVARNGTPAIDPAAPTLTVSGASTIIPGGGSQFNVTGSGPVSTLYVFVQGESGYYEIDLSSLPLVSPMRAASAADPAQLIDTRIVMQNGTELRGGAYVFEFAAGRGFGAGTRTSRNVAVQSVGTSGVQVSVSWNSSADVDLYLVEPSGETIWYGNEESATGGVLDLDSNAACFGNDVRNENINWPERTPPAGTYTVRLNYWDACEAARTDWLVTVRVPGQPTRTFTGTFTGPGVGGEEDAGQVVTSFTVGASGVVVQRATGGATAARVTTGSGTGSVPLKRRPVRR